MNVLVISNNKVSTVRNNGKTLSSLFGFVKLKNFFQLSLHNDEFDLDLGHRQVTLNLSGPKFGNQAPDKDDGFTLADLADPALQSSSAKVPSSNVKPSFFRNFFVGFLKKNLITLVVRDLIYIPSFIISFLKVSQFIKDNQIKRVFFVYSDFFSFQILVYFLILRSNVVFDIYFTDDYLLDFNNDVVRKRSGYSYVLNFFLKKLVREADNYYCISDRMAKIYEQEYGFVSKVLINSQCLDSIAFVKSHSETKVFSYFGSLHSGREASLLDFCRLVEVFNSEYKPVKIIIKVFTGQVCNPNLFAEFDFLEFHSLVLGENYIQAISDSDFLLLVEGFDSDSINATWLSCSTKIPEYLSSRKPIVAFGSVANGSIDLLHNNELAFFPSNDVSSFANCFNSVNVDEVVSKAYSFYQQNFSKSIILERLKYESI